MSSLAEPTDNFSKNESIKTDSHFLRGTILEGLADQTTGAISEADTQLTKFHGIYQQDDRDIRAERRKKKLEKAYSFMIRVRVPGGVSTAQQWLEMDRMADMFANGTLKLTTRQAYQLHGVLKGNLQRTIKEINEALLDTIAACGDVNRNVMCNPNPYQSAVHAEALKVAQAISDHLTPRTGAYKEIWIDGKLIDEGQIEEEEPIYGKTYLPRKFKIAMAIPPSNDVDVFAHCLGFIAIVEAGKLVGFNVTVGGGMGMTHGNIKTYPRLADLLGFCTVDQAVSVAEAVVKVQRDHGERADRKHARLKYTVEDLGLDKFRDLVHEHLDFNLGAPRPFEFQHLGDRYGWSEGINGKWNLNLFIQNGRVLDSGDFKLKTALREIAKEHSGDFRLSANQNLLLGNVEESHKARIDEVLRAHGVFDPHTFSGLRLNSMACVALPTCGLALSESERFLPGLVTRLEGSLDVAGLREDEIVIRMTGCPNGCARPYMAEIGFVGKAPGKYNLYLGGAFDGTRLNKLYLENQTEDEIFAALDPIFRGYAQERETGERFGDYVIRVGLVKPVKVAKTDFHG